MGNGDSETYGVDCEYTYVVNGQTYNGDRPSFYSGSDNLGSFQQDLHRRLKVAKQKGVVEVWVDPVHPQHSVLDRTFRPGFFAFSQLFACVFGTIGLGIGGFLLGSRSPRVTRGVLRIQSEHGPVKSLSTVLMAFHGGMATFSLVVAIACLLHGQMYGLIVIVFAIAFGIGFWIFAKLRSKNRHVGYLVLPIENQVANSRPHIALPASWSGPVDLDLRWMIPTPPTNQIGLEDEEADSSSVDLPSVGGTMSETQIEIEMPDWRKNQAGDMSTRLEVKGLIGGHPYEDKFELPEKYILMLRD